jgi:hypothetical protein
MQGVAPELTWDECSSHTALPKYRLGALRYTVDDYLNMIDDAGFRDVRVSEFLGDGILVEEIPWAVKYLGRPLMLAVQATKN